MTLPMTSNSSPQLSSTSELQLDGRNSFILHMAAFLKSLNCVENTENIFQILQDTWKNWCLITKEKNVQVQPQN